MGECAEQIKSNKCVVGYGAGAVKHLYWFDEFRIIVTLLSEGKTLADIKLLAETRNIFSAPTDRRSIQIFNTVSKRVLTLNKDFYELFENADLQTKKNIALTAAMNYDYLLRTFTKRLYADRLTSGHITVSDKEINMFFIELQREDDKVTTWTDYTLKKLATTYKRILIEAGLFNRIKGRDNSEFELIRQLTDNRLDELLIKNGMEDTHRILSGTHA
jgi:hypothetical protein